MHSAHCETDSRTVQCSSSSPSPRRIVQCRLFRYNLHTYHKLHRHNLSRFEHSLVDTGLHLDRNLRLVSSMLKLARLALLNVACPGVVGMPPIPHTLPNLPTSQRPSLWFP